MIHIVGIGGVGFWVAAGLCRDVDPATISLWDDDTIGDGTGHMRLPAGQRGMSKIDLFRAFVGFTMGEREPVTYRDRFTAGPRQALDIKLSDQDLVVDCSDMPIRARKVIWNRVRRTGAKLLRVSYDGRDSIIVVASGLPLASRPQGGYVEMPSLALSLLAGGAGAEVIRYYMRQRPDYVDIQINLKELIYV